MNIEDTLHRLLDDAEVEIKEVRQQLAEAEAWKEDALKALADWHALGDVLLKIAPGTIGDVIPKHLLREIPAKFAEAEAEIARLKDKAPIEIEDALHHVLTIHGIASRSDYQKLVTDLIHWAAQSCRQSQSVKFSTLTTALAALVEVANEHASIAWHSGDEVVSVSARGLANKLASLLDSLKEK